METPDSALQDYLQQLDSTSRLLLADASIGRDAEEWLGTDLGRVLAGMARQEYADALIALSKTAWWRRRRIQELQNRARCAEMFLDWLRTLVVQGRASLRAMEEQETDNGQAD